MVYLFLIFFFEIFVIFFVIFIVDFDGFVIIYNVFDILVIGYICIFIFFFLGEIKICK